MIPDSKKEEIRETADIVEVVEDYVKLKRSGRSYKGLCPFHDENTPSFHVTPDLGIYKCFGCGESGDVFNFVMEMEGIGFVEAMRTLAQRFNVSLPEEEEDQEFDEEHHLREGIYHALRYAGVYYYRQLLESNEAEPARQYLQKRGYDRQVMQKFGLGYSPKGGERFYKAALDSGLNEEYLEEAGLIKPSKRGSGYYDAFRGRLMFPIFNPSGKVIAFAGRVLGDEKTAKYINSPQTKVYNKSEVLYGVNFAKGGIRKSGNVLLVEGYTDVITLNQHDIENVVASSGTSLTKGQMHLLHRYGDTITMIYDSDSAGQAAMKRGINIGLAEGMDVKLLELPEGEDPDSFVRQFGKDSFLELKEENSEDFLSYLIHKAQNEGRWDDPAGRKKVIKEILGSIAYMPEQVARETYVQFLNEFTKVGDRALFKDLKQIRTQLKSTERRRKRFENRRKNKDEISKSTKGKTSDRNAVLEEKKKPGHEKELIRLMLFHKEDMVEYIGSFCNENEFSDPELKNFYKDIIESYKKGKEISVQAYSDREHPYPKLVAEVSLNPNTPSERHPEIIGRKLGKDTRPFKNAKYFMKILKTDYFKRVEKEFDEKFHNENDPEKKKKLNRKVKEFKIQKSRYNSTNYDELFPDPDSDKLKVDPTKVFEYKMKGEK